MNWGEIKIALKDIPDDAIIEIKSGFFHTRETIDKLTVAKDNPANRRFYEYPPESPPKRGNISMKFVTIYGKKPEWSNE